MNKAIGTLVVIVIIVVAGFLIFGKGNSSPTPTYTPTASSSMAPTATPTPTPISGTGKVIIEIADKAADMTAVSEISMTVSKVEVHSEAKGWMTVMAEPSTYKLLSLKSSGHLQFAGQASASSGLYDQVKLTIDKVMVKTKDGAQKTAKLPGKMFAVMTSATVNGKQTTSIKVDIIADKSLYTTTTGEYVFAPTAQVQASSNVTASVDSHDVVTLSDGMITSDTNAGMDLDGTVKADFMLDANAVIKLEGSLLKL